MAQCEYCGSVLERNVTKCPGCGAPAPHNVSNEPGLPATSSPELAALMRTLMPLMRRMVDILMSLLSIFPGSRKDD